MGEVDYLKYQRKLNTLLAMPLYVHPTDFRKDITGTQPMFAYQCISEIIVIVITTAQLLAIPHIFHDMNILCGCLSSGSHSLQVLLKTGFLRFYRKQYLSHFKKTNAIQSEINEFAKDSSHTNLTNFSEYHSTQSRYIRIVATIQLLVNFASTSAYFLPFIYDCMVHSDVIANQLLPIVVYIGIDHYSVSLFQIMTFILTIGFYCVNLKSVVIDNFILNIIVLHLSQLRYHKNMLKEIQKSFSKAKKNEENEKAKSELIKAWIKQHQALLSLYSEFQKIARHYFSMEFIYIFFHTCVPAFVITATLSWTTAQKFAVFFMVGGGIITLLLMSLAGASFTRELQETGNIMFDADLVSKKDKWMSRAYLIIQQRLRRTFNFSAYIIPLNCESFLSLVRLIFSYYVTLSQIQKIKRNDVA